MIICILQKGTMGTLLYLNSQEEQIISDHTDHSQLKPEQGTALLGMLPGAVCQCPLRHCSRFGQSQIIRLTPTSRLCWARVPLDPTHTAQSRLHLFSQQTAQNWSRRSPVPLISELHCQSSAHICVFVRD